MRYDSKSTVNLQGANISTRLIQYLPLALKSRCTHLHIRKSSQGTEECHSLAAARGSTEHHGFVLRQPGVQKSFMSHSVDCWYHNIRGSHLMRFYLNLRNLRLP